MEDCYGYRMPTIAIQDIAKLKKLYIEDKLCMREIAEHFGVSIDAVTYAMRKHSIPRRSMKEMIALRFERKPMSFVRRRETAETNKLEIIGTTLYWGEGSKNPTNCSVDFANSDPGMIKLFMVYLRSVYTLDEQRLRGSIYCYSDQNVSELILFWSKISGIPRSQFTKPYVRIDFREGGRKMPYGLMHVRYSDKKLLLDILRQIEKLKDQYCVGGGVVNRRRL
jgi:hypothetical protein